jgi:hypothetical protein
MRRILNIMIMNIDVGCKSRVIFSKYCTIISLEGRFLELCVKIVYCLEQLEFCNIS